MPKQTGRLIHVLVVDDHELMRMGIRTLLKRDPALRVVGEAGTKADAVTEALRLKPDVVLLDVRLPDGSGADACREIRASCPDTRILFLTSFEDEEAVRATIVGGAHGYLFKQIGGAVLIRTIKTLVAGQPLIDPAATFPLLTRLSLPSGLPAEGESELLSPQEQRVLALVAEGKTNKEVAVELGLSAITVRNYLCHVFQKLQITRRFQLGAFLSRKSP